MALHVVAVVQRPPRIAAAVLSLIVLLPVVTVAQQLPFRWNFGASQPWTDPDTGLVWLPDIIPSGRVVTTPCTEQLFIWSARNELVCSRKEWDRTTGNALEFPVPVSGMYKADVYLSESNGQAGARILDVYVENQLVYPNLDVVGQSENPTSVFTLTATFPVTDGAFSMRIDSKGTAPAATVAGMSLERVGNIPFVEVPAPPPPPPPPPPMTTRMEQPDFVLTNPSGNTNDFIFINPVPRPAPAASQPGGTFPITFSSPATNPTQNTFNDIPATNPTLFSFPNRDMGPIIPINFNPGTTGGFSASTVRNPPPPPPPLFFSPPPPPPPAPLVFSPPPPPPPAPLVFSPPPPPPPAPLSISQPESATATTTGNNRDSSSSSSSTSSTYRIDVGATTTHVDRAGVFWDHDALLQRSGRPSTIQNKCTTHGFASYPDPNLLCVYREWNGATTGVLQFPVTHSGPYDIQLILPETYARVGTRVVDIYLEDWLAFAQLDVTERIGGTPYGMFTLTATQFVTDGAVSIELRATQGVPVLAAITIEPSTRTAEQQRNNNNRQRFLRRPTAANDDEEEEQQEVQYTAVGWQ